MALNQVVCQLIGGPGDGYSFYLPVLDKRNGPSLTFDYSHFGKVTKYTRGGRTKTHWRYLLKDAKGM